MYYTKKYFVICLIVFLFSGVVPVYAGLIINEIMFDAPGTDTDNEWVELYNDGSESVDISGYKFFEANTNHSLVSYLGGTIVQPQGYAVIAGSPAVFLSAWPNFNGVLLDSSFSLQNENGEMIALKNASGTIVDSVTYEPVKGGAGNGATLGLYAGNWTEVVASPGVLNSKSESIVSEANSNDTPSQEQAETKQIVQPKSVTGTITSPSKVRVSSEIHFSSSIFDTDGSSINRGYFVWSFGDGASFEEIQKSPYVAHKYEYPGVYVVTCAYYRSQYSEKPDVVARTTIEVVEGGLSIEKVFPDGAVTIANNSILEVDLGGMQLIGNGLVFQFPKRTFLPAKGSITVSAKTSHFIPPLTLVSIQTIEGILLSTRSEVPPASRLGFMHDNSISKKVSATVAHAETSMATTTPDVVNEIIYGDTNTQGKETSNIRKYGIYGGFFIFLVVVVVVFRLLQKNRRSSDGDSSEDFEIVE